MVPRVPANLVEHLAGFALIEPTGGLLGGVGRLAHHLTGQPGIAVPFGHRTEVLAQITQARGGPPLLCLRLISKLSSGLTCQLLGLPPRLCGHLPALLSCGVGNLTPGLRGLLADARGLLAGLLSSAALVR
ncbi:hypothetical protein AB0K35_07625 [Micromonospora sp. NPDC053740]|uniref:hypothetical protein n=1 Tax=Micromonospora sp. NPDC053740 TaxID=3155173 RepID=UPI00341BC74F